MDDVIVINKHEAHKIDHIAADGRPHVDSVAGRLHRFDDAGSNSSPTSAGSGVSLVQSLLGGGARQGGCGGWSRSRHMQF